MQKTIKLQPEKITELAQKINDTISSLTNIEAIIRDTEEDLNNAKIVKQQAMEAKWGFFLSCQILNTIFPIYPLYVHSYRNKAEKILQVTDKVVSALNMTEELQRLAESAIQMANENISLAKKDLGEVS